MLRFTDNMLNNKALEETIGFGKREEEFMRTFFLERVQEESVLSGQAFMYLHYADMIANGYIRTMPCPFQSQGLLLNPNGSLFYCENSKEIGNVLDETRGSALLQGRKPGAPRGREEQRLPDLPQPVPGERRGDEAVRSVCGVPDARLPPQARPLTPSRDDSDVRTARSWQLQATSFCLLACFQLSAARHH